MWGFARASNLTAALVLGAATASADVPTRVVSLNICTDLMVMMLAPDLIVSLSTIASDPTTSPLANQAKTFPQNQGSAEEIFLSEPDLVLAGNYTERATTQMLEHLGIPVEVFPPATSLDQMRTDMRRMGNLLGREARAETLLAEFDSALADLPTSSNTPAMAYFANGYSPGDGTLTNAVIKAAGLRNLSAEAGITGGAMVPLEMLVTTAPALIITGERYPGASRSEAILDHPALQRVGGSDALVVVPDRDWGCGTPLVLAAITRLAHAGEAVR